MKSGVVIWLKCLAPLLVSLLLAAVLWAGVHFGGSFQIWSIYQQHPEWWRTFDILAVSFTAFAVLHLLVSVYLMNGPARVIGYMIVTLAIPAQLASLLLIQAAIWGR